MKDVVGNIVQKAQCKFYKEPYSWQSIGGNGLLRRHVATCVPKHVATGSMGEGM